MKGYFCHSILLFFPLQSSLLTTKQFALLCFFSSRSEEEWTDKIPAERRSLGRLLCGWINVFSPLCKAEHSTTTPVFSCFLFIQFVLSCSLKICKKEIDFLPEKRGSSNTRKKLEMKNQKWRNYFIFELFFYYRLYLQKMFFLFLEVQ